VASVLWSRHADLATSAARHLRGWPGVPDERRAALSKALEATADEPVRPADWIVEIDRDPALSLSLHAFRRRPWPAGVAAVEVDAERLRTIEREWGAGPGRALSEAFDRGCRELTSSPSEPSGES
jgi:hypothetical protein